MELPPGEYYLQDNRTHVGNSMLWWAKDSKGYTCDIRKAHVFRHDEIPGDRKTDVPWPKEYIDERISHHIDHQHCDLTQAAFQAHQGSKR